MLIPVTDEVALYLGTSKHPPHRRIVETIVTVKANRQMRSIQIIEDGVWTQTIAIDERRVE